MWKKQNLKYWHLSRNLKIIPFPKLKLEKCFYKNDDDDDDDERQNTFFGGEVLVSKV